jgi:hypothetical protein
MMHRDNLDIPVSEWWMRSTSKFSRVVSPCWRLELEHRTGAGANEYAAFERIAGFSALSNNFSLARMVIGVGRLRFVFGCRLPKRGFEEHKIANFSWSSQARGFFARAIKTSPKMKKLVRCWYCDDNFERLERAQQLAKEKGVSPVVIAAAYVLAQKFSGLCADWAAQSGRNARFDGRVGY